MTEDPARTDASVTAWAPGRVNLIGEHTDYSGGLAVPMAIDLGVTITGRRGGDVVRLRSDAVPGELELPLAPPGFSTAIKPAGVEPAWGRYVAGVVAELGPSSGFVGEVRSTLPVGAGLSSSAALEVATALALGFSGPGEELARLAQRAEQVASGVPCGLMDQLASACGIADHALLVDFTTLEVTPIRLPADLEIVVIHSGTPRTLVGSAYADRRAACEAAATAIGSLRAADDAALAGLADPVLRRRARHVVRENARVEAFVEALANDDLAAAGALVSASHASLRDDFEVSTRALDELVERLERTPGVHGARLTGAGFGGCVVALTEPGALDDRWGGWHVRASAGAHVEPAVDPRSHSIE